MILIGLVVVQLSSESHLCLNFINVAIFQFEVIHTVHEVDKFIERLRKNCLTPWVVTFTIITWIVPRFAVVHYFRLVLGYDDCHAIHGDFACLTRRPIDVFQSNIFWSFVFAARQLTRRFRAMRIARSGKLSGSVLGTDERWIQSRFSCWSS